jgi:SAM-dependent methyltransferase
MINAWVCPHCRGRLVEEESSWHCPVDNLKFPVHDGIWRFLTPDRQAYYQTFIDQYETVRLDQGWGSDSAAYYNALPFDDATGRHKRIWQIRAQGYLELRKNVVDPKARNRNQPLHILDLGAGNGWLSNRLAQLGHEVIAADVLVNPLDGLGARIHYDTEFTPVQAEYDRLPIDDEQIDIIIYNGSFHYSTDYQRTLVEGLRVLAPDGDLVVLDTPIYHDPASGIQMVEERRALFEERYQFEGPSLDSQNFLSFNQLGELSISVDVEWTFLEPAYGLRWRMRHWLARLRQTREPATFLVLVGNRKVNSSSGE